MTSDTKGTLLSSVFCIGLWAVVVSFRAAGISNQFSRHWPTGLAYLCHASHTVWSRTKQMFEHVWTSCEADALKLRAGRDGCARPSRLVRRLSIYEIYGFADAGSHQSTGKWLSKTD